MKELTAEHKQFLEAYEQFETNGGSSSPAWLRELRREGMVKFVERGFPTTSDEEWRFTNLSPLLRGTYALGKAYAAIPRLREQLKPFFIQTETMAQLVILNGRANRELSRLDAIPDGVFIGSLRDAIENGMPIPKTYLNQRLKTEQNAFAALNTAFLHDGVVIHVPNGVQCVHPIEVIHVVLNSHSASYPRVLIVVDDDAKAEIVLTYCSVDVDSYFVNAATEVAVGNRAHLNIVQSQLENEKAFHVNVIQGSQGEGSTLSFFSLALGAQLARHDIAISVDGAHCETMLDGLTITAGEQLVDHHTMIDHREESCSSREVFKGILAGASRTVFNGKIFVRQAAQKTDSKQTNKNLLLSDHAVIDTKPQLEIFADDVKCTHGATVGGLDQASMFYVKSRGIGEEVARGLLTVGFASEVTDFISNPAIKRQIDRYVVHKLQRGILTSALPDIVHQDHQNL